MTEYTVRTVYEKARAMVKNDGGVYPDKSMREMAAVDEAERAAAIAHEKKHGAGHAGGHVVMPISCYNYDPHTGRKQGEKIGKSEISPVCAEEIRREMISGAKRIVPVSRNER